jgi:hypothetical protein
MLALDDRHMSWNGQRWSNWESLGGRFRAPLSSVSWGENRLDVFGQDADTGFR